MHGFSLKNIKPKLVRGKNLDYRYITGTKAIVYKKVVHFMLSTKELEKYFYTYQVLEIMACKYMKFESEDRRYECSVSRMGVCLLY